MMNTKSGPLLLATVNARYSHSSFGMRCLKTALEAAGTPAELREFTNDMRPEVIAEALLREQPWAVALGVYIWNRDVLTPVAEIIKAVRPAVLILIGGPEAGHEYESTRLFRAADYLLRGEGEVILPELLREIEAGRAPKAKVIESPPLDLSKLPLPYEAYTDEDIAHRAIYVESTRGCPFRCAFCLSGRAEDSVRYYPLPPFFEAMDKLLARGALHFRFIDRTFNVKTDHALAILDFFLARLRPKLLLHLEIVPDKLQPQVLEKMAEFPPEVLHLEAGVQSFHPPSLEAIDRRQDLEKACATLRWLRENTGVLIHADLLVGLPHESEATFAKGFDQLVALRPHEIQVGPLKRLRGSPLSQKAASLGLHFAQNPPYLILQSPTMAYETIQALGRFARYMDLYYNSGNFPESIPVLFASGPSPYHAFRDLCESIWRETGRTHHLSLVNLMEHLYACLLEKGLDPEKVDALIHRDFHRIPNRHETIRPYGVRKMQ